MAARLPALWHVGRSCNGCQRRAHPWYDHQRHAGCKEIYPTLTYAYTYADDSVNSDATLNENFVIGDLPRDVYEVYISNGNGRVLFRQLVEIQSERVSWLDIQLPTMRQTAPVTG